MRTIEVLDDERRVLLRLLDREWFALDKEHRDVQRNDQELTYMRDLEALQEKLK